jgi:tripartite-type tricarboxylate transporter receptor subunit TctC
MYLTRCLATLACLLATAAIAEQYPSRPIHLIVPWPPGQNTDVAARLVAERLAIALEQPIVVENRPGAGGLIGTEAAARAAPDGYTLLAASSGPVSIAPNVQSVPFKVATDFQPVCLLLTNPFVLVANPNISAATVAELVKLLRTQPGHYSFSSSGSGATSHLMSVQFNTLARVDAVHVPYKGSPQSVTDVVNGQVAYTIETIPAVKELVRTGRLRALGVTTARRSAAMPEVPPIADTDGFGDYDIPAWVGILAPAGVPRDRVERIAREVRKILEDGGVRERMLALGMEPAASTPDEFASFLQAQNLRFGAIAREARLKPD